MNPIADDPTDLIEFKVRGLQIGGRKKKEIIDIFMLQIITEDADIDSVQLDGRRHESDERWFKRIEILQEWVDERHDLLKALYRQEGAIACAMLYPLEILNGR